MHLSNFEWLALALVVAGILIVVFTPSAPRGIEQHEPDMTLLDLGAHDCYEGFDADAPESIRDRNGEVVLGLCRKCGAGEIELEEPCDVRIARLDALFDERDRQLLRDQRVREGRS